MILALMHAKIEHLLWTFLHLLDVSSFFSSLPLSMSGCASSSQLTTVPLVHSVSMNVRVQPAWDLAQGDISLQDIQMGVFR